MSRQPRRVRMSRQTPWRNEHPDAVIVARPSNWSNPYWVRRANGKIWIATRNHATKLALRDADQLTADEYREYRQKAVDLFRVEATELTYMFRAAIALGGKDLACWCELDAPCHADVLLDIANNKALHAEALAPSAEQRAWDIATIGWPTRDTVAELLHNMFATSAAHWRHLNHSAQRAYTLDYADKVLELFGRNQ